MHVKNRVQLCEVQQIPDLAARVGELELSPGFPARAVALRTALPAAVVVPKQCGSTVGADGLSDRAEREHKFAQPAAIDIRNLLEVDENFIIAFGDFIANRFA